MRLDVHGTPAPQGSKRGFVRGGRVVLVEASERVRPWRDAVKVAVALDGRGQRFDREPVTVSAEFRLRRPRSHYRTGRHADQVRAGAPAYPTGTPDVDKLLRSTLDGLTEAGVFVDDAQVVCAVAVKRWCRAGETPGAVLNVDVAPSVNAQVTVPGPRSHL